MARNKRKRSGGDKEPPESADPPRKRPKARGSDASTSKGGAAQACIAGGAPCHGNLRSEAGKLVQSFACKPHNGYGLINFGIALIDYGYGNIDRGCHIQEF